MSREGACSWYKNNARGCAILTNDKVKIKDKKQARGPGCLYNCQKGRGGTRLDINIWSKCETLKRLYR